MGDVFVNDAFAVSHRAHTSIISLSKFLPSELGPLFKKEIQELLGFQTFQNTSMTDVVDRVLGDISMQGLHNFGCRFNDEGLSLVSFSLYEKEGEKKKIWTTSCWIDRGGHLVRGRQNEGFWF